MIQTDGVAAPLAPFSAAARVAGAVIAMAYLLGLVPGPLVTVVGGLALITFGRALLLPLLPSARAVLSLAVIAGAVGIGALRWGTLDLAELRGVQAVLGPTVTVGPPAAAIACGIALGAAVVVLAVWFLEPAPGDRTDHVWGGFEVALVALALATIFIDPARSVLHGAGLAIALLEIVRWAGVTAVTAAVALGIARLLRDTGDFVRWVVLGVAGAAVAVAAALIAGTL